MDMSKFKNLPVVDCHVHFWNYADEGNMVKIKDACRFSRVNVLSTYDRIKVNENPEGIYLKAKHPDAFYVFGGLDYSSIFSGGK
ncbi:MAG: hypothetical protein JTT11_04350, partial [Candidatus Brockarchaeota archaeon]|nr:hypothetical protein [Candidatus Brockarchaeota archaeon]